MTWNTLLGDTPLLTLLGMCKNAGKTTVLGNLIAAFSHETLGLTSIGLDGENRDQITGTQKPGIMLPAGTLFATARGLLPRCSAAPQVLAVTRHMTPLGYVVICRAQRKGGVVLAGPSSAALLPALAEELYTLGATRVLIDGAAGRVSQASAGGVGILCVGASLHSEMHQVVEQTAHMVQLFATPAGTDATAHRVEGAVTTTLLRRLTGQVTCISTPNATHLLADAQTVAVYRRQGGSFLVDTPIALAAVAANPWSAYGSPFPREEFLNALSNAIPLPVVDGKECLL